MRSEPMILVALLLAATGQITARGDPALGLALRHAATTAFLRGLTADALAGAVAAAGAVLAVLFLPARPDRPAPPSAQPTQAETQTVAADCRQTVAAD